MRRLPRALSGSACPDLAGGPAPARVLLRCLPSQRCGARGAAERSSEPACVIREPAHRHPADRARPAHRLSRRIWCGCAATSRPARSGRARARWTRPTRRSPTTSGARRPPAGITSSMLPAELGGGSTTSVLTQCLVQEELCTGDIAIGNLLTSGGFFAAPILELGTLEQQQRWIPPIAVDDSPRSPPSRSPSPATAPTRPASRRTRCAPPAVTA